MTALQRLVYSPKAYAFIYSRKNNGEIIDVSNDISGGSVQRFVNKPSTATLTLRNDNWKYTGRFDPMFYPMDGITIWLQRFAGVPIQVFTGFIDSIPYYQAYPGEIEIKATCTLKQFMYTHFDPGVGFLNWLVEHGWIPDVNGNVVSGFFNPEALSALGDGVSTDSGIGQLLHDFLTEVAGVDPESIVIGKLPKDLPQTMLEAYKRRVAESEAAQASLIDVLGAILTIDAAHSADQPPEQNSESPTGISDDANSVDTKALLSAVNQSRLQARPSDFQTLLAALVMSGLNKSFDGKNKDSASFGQGFFADPSIPKAVGSRGRQRGSSEKALTITEQAKKFYTVWSQILGSSSPVGRPAPNAPESDQDSVTTDVARVLAYGYGKEQFFSEILEACNSAANKNAAEKILNNILSNQNFDDVKSLDVITAGEVSEELDPVEVTWDELFAETDLQETDPIEVGPDAKQEGTTVSLNVGDVFSSRLEVYSPKGNASASEVAPIKIGSGAGRGTPVKYTDIKYYLHGVWSGENGDDGSGGRFMRPKFTASSNIEVGQIVKIYNPKNKKSCRCVYLGVKSKRTNRAFLTISGDAVAALGGSDTRDGFVTQPLTFEITSDKLPGPAINDNDTGPTALARYVEDLKNVIGQSTKPSENSYLNTNINSSDRDVYEARYKGTNQRLAEYFYIASNYDLHLMDVERQSKDKLFLYGDPEQIVEFLKNIGIAKESSSTNQLDVNSFFQSRPKNIQLSLGTNTAYYDLNPATGAVEFRQIDRAPMQRDFSPIESAIMDSGRRGVGGAIVIQATESDPRPVWDGRMVRLPESATSEESSPGQNNATAVTWADVGKVAASAAFSTLTAFPWDLIGSTILRGEKSLMNDIPIIEGITQLCQGSMRHFMSLPNGMFCAFYPDHFGRFGRKPYMTISDVEVMDFNIVLNDEPIVTHMYVNGQTYTPTVPVVDDLSRWVSAGVITIEDVLSGSLNIVNSPESVTGIEGDASDQNDGSPTFQLSNSVEPDLGYSEYYDNLGKESLEFLQVYGTRPKIENNPLIRSPWFEFITAYNLFAYQWSMHTATTAVLTFMPELMAGGLVEFEDQGVIMYVEGVNHTWNYTSGFQTSAFFSAPSTPEGDDSVPGLVLFRSTP